MNLIQQQQQHKLLEGHLTNEDDYQDWIQWVEIKEKERIIGYVIKSPPYVHITVEIEPFANVSDDGDIWIEICSKMQFNPRLIALQHREFFDLLQEFQDAFAWHKGELGTSNMGEHSIDM